MRATAGGQYCRLRFFRFNYLAVSAYLSFTLAVSLPFSPFPPSFFYRPLLLPRALASS